MKSAFTSYRWKGIIVTNESDFPYYVVLYKRTIVYGLSRFYGRNIYFLIHEIRSCKKKDKIA